VLDSDKLGKVQAKLFDMYVEPKLIQPTFVYGYPTDISPLSRRNDADPSITDRSSCSSPAGRWPTPSPS
jgi:lysyl-tRNA synthetase class 2